MHGYPWPKPNTGANAWALADSPSIVEIVADSGKLAPETNG